MDKQKKKEQFLQMLDRLKVERGINDEEAGKLIDAKGNYLAKIRGGFANPGPKLISKLSYVLAHPSYQLQEKTNVYSGSGPVALPEDLLKQLALYAEDCGIDVREFVTRCLVDCARTFRDDLTRDRKINSPQTVSEIAQEEIDAGIESVQTRSRPPAK